MNHVVEHVLRDLLRAPIIDEGVADARRAWLRHQFGLGTRWSVSEDVVALGHQLALLSSDVPPSMDQFPDDLRHRTELIAATIDIAARVAVEREREFFKLAASLYITAQQPTRAHRAAVRLLAAEQSDTRLARYYRLLEHAYRMNGAHAVATVEAGISKETLGDSGHSLDEALEALAWDPPAFRVIREAEVALRYRKAHDLRTASEDVLPPEFVARAYNGPPWSRRQELLPSQAAIVRAGLLRAERAFVSTPTGTGKTFLAELKIANLLARRPQALVVYVAPLNALARQVHRDFQRRLRFVGRVTLWTGAYEIDDDVRDLGNVLVTTPEKLDSILRLDLADDPRSHDLLSRLSLIVADEAHQVSDGPRGVLYEFLLLRLMRRLAHVEVLGLSAVQPDPGPFGRFLSDKNYTADVHEVSWSAASVWDVLWTKSGELTARLDFSNPPKLPRPKQSKAAAALAAATLLERLESVLLVEARRDWAESLAAELFKNYREYLDARLNQNMVSESDHADLRELSEQIQSRLYPSHPLAQYVVVGLAVHHAGLPPSIRRRIEELARRELIHTVVATTTLAEGVDLPFRAVVLCRLTLPFGLPFRAARLRNIRGRAARPGFASDGIFLILEPENTDSAAYQYFLDHYWDDNVSSVESLSALSELFSSQPIQRAPALRSLESQLLAYFSENDVELESAGAVAGETLFTEASGRSSIEASRLAAGIQGTAVRMLEGPALLRVASPLKPTPLGRAAVLGGLSASSALLARGAILANLPDIPGILEEAGAAELAIRLAWLPWEAVETTDEYRNVVSRRREYIRSAERLPGLVDKRLDAQYKMARLLLSPRLLPELAATERDVIRGKSDEDRLARLVEWGGRAGGVLPWTLTGVLRVADSLVEENPEIAMLGTALLPYVQYLSAWVVAPGGAEIVRRGILDRDTAIELLNASDLWGGSGADLVEWAMQNEGDAIRLIGAKEYRALLRNDRSDLEIDDENGGQG